ncbi:MAG TPA: hypothetical protein VKP30_26545, partial [Polyangiaceae bacterium]|nr:hypothetical protein [Polyangiaceae bacterium]
MAVDVKATGPTTKAGDVNASDAAASSTETSNAETSNADLSTPEASNADNSSADAQARRARRRKSSRRSALSRLRSEWQRRAPWVLGILLTLAVAGSLLAVGTVHIPVLLFIAPLCILFGAFAIVVEDTPTWQRRLPALILVGLGLYSGLQSIALPESTLRQLSPVAARVWSDAFRLLGEPLSRWASVSVDPSASRVEALKWICYAAVFFGAAKLGREKGSQPGTLIVFGSAVLGGVLSVAHGLFGIEEWLGLYRPQMTSPVWALAPLLNPNNFAGYLNLAIFAGMGLLFAHQPL